MNSHVNIQFQSLINVYFINLFITYYFSQINSIFCRNFPIIAYAHSIFYFMNLMNNLFIRPPLNLNQILVPIKMIHFGNRTLSILTTCPVHLIFIIVIIVPIGRQFALASTPLLLTQSNQYLLRFNFCHLFSV